MLRVLFFVLALSLSAADIDETLLAQPQALALRERAAELHWQALFAPMPRDPVRHLLGLAEGAGDLYPTLLAARLLYRGPPWTRRGDESGLAEHEWRKRSRTVQLAVLRELRLRQDGGLDRIYIALLRQEDDPELCISALVNLLRLNPATGLLGAARLANPSHAETLPAARWPATRRRALAILVARVSLSDPEALNALAWALEHGDGDERNAALALITPGQASDLVRTCLITVGTRVLALPATAPALAADLTTLETIADLLGDASHPEVAALLSRLVLCPQRAAALAACRVLSRRLPPGFALPAAELFAAAQATTDAAVRHGLLGLLVRQAPAILAAAGDDATWTARVEPWRRLAEHRARLAHWDGR